MNLVIVIQDFQTCKTKSCPPGEYLCHSAYYCIPSDLMCDGIKHCYLGDDEMLCGNLYF